MGTIAKSAPVKYVGMVFTYLLLVLILFLCGIQ